MKDKNLTALPLFCKPERLGIVYEKKISDATISFKSLDLTEDLAMIHKWVNMDYTKTFWQMRGSIGLLRSCYQCILQNPFAHSFTGMYNGAPVCQFDIYKVANDELATHIDFEDQDCGFHLLMAPRTIPIRRLTITLIECFLEFYFSHSPASKMFAEPDIQNSKSILLLESAGFEKIKTVELSYKTAHVYSLTKEKFYASHQTS
jgi:acetyl CoA:N6-hydroxylysine acetyl transferase